MTNYMYEYYYTTPTGKEQLCSFLLIRHFFWIIFGMITKTNNRKEDEMKKISKILLLFVMTITLCSTLNANAATSKTVNNEAELKEALNNSNISTIILGSNIETTEKINIMRDVTIDGNNKTIRYIGKFGASQSNDNTVWGGIYVLQIYKCNVTLKDIKLTGGNAGLLINGGHATFEGRIDVSGNGFGGIELGKGSGVTSSPTLTITDNAEIINTTESADKPTLWVPSDTNGAVIEIGNTEFELNAGVELSLDEINELEESIENPETGDSLILNIIFLSIFVILSSYAFKKILNKE